MEEPSKSAPVYVNADEARPIGAIVAEIVAVIGESHPTDDSLPPMGNVGAGKWREDASPARMRPRFGLDAVGTHERRLSGESAALIASRDNSVRLSILSSPRSHLETVDCVTPRREAKSACDKLRSLRYDVMSITQHICAYAL